MSWAATATHAIHSASGGATAPARRGTLEHGFHSHQPTAATVVHTGLLGRAAAAAAAGGEGAGDFFLAVAVAVAVAVFAVTVSLCPSGGLVRLQRPQVRLERIVQRG